MKILLTGANGFIARNLLVFLREAGINDVICLGRDHSDIDLKNALSSAEFIFHLAGVNRPHDVSEFTVGNHDLTKKLVDFLEELNRVVPVVFSSSIQAEGDHPYAVSKRAAESVLLNYSQRTGARVAIFRLPNIFGKWSRPFYNSAVATFCHQISRGEAITIHDPENIINLAYIDDLCRQFISLLSDSQSGAYYTEVAPVYKITVGELAAKIQDFKDSRQSLVTERVGSGLVRALYATYVSFLPSPLFSYEVPAYNDPRGIFVEMLKTPDCGQFSYFTAGPGVTRGGHYHHTKSEKFLVIRGKARFGFRHIDTNAYHEILVDGGMPTIVETIPGWAHDITNIGDDEMIVMLWANENFDRQHPDTIGYKV